MSRIIKSRRAKVLLGTMAALAITAIAIAYWTTSGSTSTTASTQEGASQAFTFTAANTPSGLAPGAGAKELTGTVKNSDVDTSYKLQTVTAVISSVTGPNIDGTHPCTVDDYRLSDLDPATGDQWVISNTDVGTHSDQAVFSPQDDLVAGDDRSFADLGVELLDQAHNQDGCKSATVHIDYSAN